MIKFTAQKRGRLAKLIEREGVPYYLAMKLIRGREVKLNGKRTGTDEMCEIGDLIEVYAEKKQDKPLDIIYSDDNVAVLNKPFGVETDELEKRLKEEIPSARAVHRLDRNTRGVIIYALSDEAEAELKKGFKDRTFKKIYLAEVWGVPEKSSAVIRAYLEKDAASGTVYIHDTRQKGDVEIATAYTVLSSSGSTSVLEVELLTGRTHQIRAHLAHIGHPIIGDGKYGDRDVNKRFHASVQRLQAKSITLAFPPSSPLAYLDGREFSVPAEIGKKPTDII